MPTRLHQPRLLPAGLTRAGLTRLAAGLALAASPALAAGPASAAERSDAPEGVVRTGDRSAVTPVAASQVAPPPGPAAARPADCPPAACPPGGHVGHPVGAPYCLPGAGLVGGHLSKFAPDGYITWGEIGYGLRNKPPLIPPLGCYDAYLPPDYGWQAPIGYPVQRARLPYNRYYPSQWYGLPGSQKPRVAPTVFMPTDTTQLGYYYQHVPTWQPAPPGSFPPAPDPRVLHRTEQAQGPDLGTHPGFYPGAPRACPLRDPVTGGLVGHGLLGHDHLGHGAVSYGHGPHGGTIVTEPALPAPTDDCPADDCPPGDPPSPPTVNYGPALDVPAPAPGACYDGVRPLPSSTEPAAGDAADAPAGVDVDADVPPGAPVPGDLEPDVDPLSADEV